MLKTLSKYANSAYSFYKIYYKILNPVLIVFLLVSGFYYTSVRPDLIRKDCWQKVIASAGSEYDYLVCQRENGLETGVNPRYIPDKINIETTYPIDVRTR